MSKFTNLDSFYQEIGSQIKNKNVTDFTQFPPPLNNKMRNSGIQFHGTHFARRYIG